MRSISLNKILLFLFIFLFSVNIGLVLYYFLGVKKSEESQISIKNQLSTSFSFNNQVFSSYNQSFGTFGRQSIDENNRQVILKNLTIILTHQLPPPKSAFFQYQNQGDNQPPVVFGRVIRNQNLELYIYINPQTLSNWPKEQIKERVEFYILQALYLFNNPELLSQPDMIIKTVSEVKKIQSQLGRFIL